MNRRKNLSRLNQFSEIMDSADYAIIFDFYDGLPMLAANVFSFGVYESPENDVLVLQWEIKDEQFSAFFSEETLNSQNIVSNDGRFTLRDNDGDTITFEVVKSLR